MTQRGHKEISGRARLAEMEPVFTKQALIFRFGMNLNTAQVMLSRWHRRDGLVMPLGGRSEVYFNLQKDPSWHAHFEQALKLAVPHAITIGQSAYSHGWISQLPNARHLAVPTAVQIYTVEGCQFHYRPREWFMAIAPGVQYKTHTIPELKPAWALADALFAKMAYKTGVLAPPMATDGLAGARSAVPDPDDLYVDGCTTKDAREFRQAVDSLKNFYGFPELFLDGSCHTMQPAYAAVHAAVLGIPSQYHTASPGL